MQDLPSDLLKKIGSYCPADSAVCLSRLSKGLHEVLSLSTAEWELWRNERHWLGGYRDVRTFVEPIPIVLPRHLVQSVRLCCTWKDQTWGNRKGVLFVSTSDKHLTDDSIVAQSGIAEHTETALKIEFHPKEGENYYLWRYVGGGGGHELKVRNMRVASCCLTHLGGIMHAIWPHWLQTVQPKVCLASTVSYQSLRHC